MRNVLDRDRRLHRTALLPIGSLLPLLFGEGAAIQTDICTSRTAFILVPLRNALQQIRERATAHHHH